MILIAVWPLTYFTCRFIFTLLLEQGVPQDRTVSGAARSYYLRMQSFSKR